MAKPVPSADEWPEKPDAWKQADKAWDSKWTDRQLEDEGEDGYSPPSERYTPESPATQSLRDSYGDGMRAAGPYLGLGIQIGGAMILFVGAGLLVDRWLDSSPWGVVLGAVLGMVGIVALVMRVAQDAEEKANGKPGA